MSAHTTNVQIIKKDGKPIFAVMPYEEYLALLREDDETMIPNEVAGMVIMGNMNLLKAWRKHLGLTQKEVAKRAGITQASLSQMEKNAQNLRGTTLKKLSAAMGISPEQLND